jgi:hypothetical protein
MAPVPDLFNPSPETHQTTLLLTYAFPYIIHSLHRQSQQHAGPCIQHMRLLKFEVYLFFIMFLVGSLKVAISS